MRNRLFDGVELFALGLCLPVVLDGLLLRLFPYNPHGVAWWISSGIGFYFASRRLRVIARVLFACVYFPFMFLVFFFGGMLVPFLTFRLHDFP